MSIKFLGFSFKERLLYQISCKSIPNLVASMWSIVFFMYITMFWNILKYIYRLYYIHGMSNIYFAYIVDGLVMLGN
jgi:hypothetical protein